MSLTERELNCTTKIAAMKAAGYMAVKHINLFFLAYNGKILDYSYPHYLEITVWESAQCDIWNILLELGADATMECYFYNRWPRCREFRFQGKLGFGGKIWAGDTLKKFPCVTCFPGDETPERLDMIRTANIKLVELCTNKIEI